MDFLQIRIAQVVNVPAITVSGKLKYCVRSVSQRLAATLGQTVVLLMMRPFSGRLSSQIGPSTSPGKKSTPGLRLTALDIVRPANNLNQ